MLSLIQLNYLLPTYASILLIIANYMIITTLSFVVFNGLQISSLKATSTNNKAHVLFTTFNVLFFLNLAGVPPLPGFFIKLNLLISILNNVNLYLITILLVVNFTIFYFYIQFYKSINSYSKVRNINLQKNLEIPLLILLVLLVNFYPLYNTLLLYIL